MFYPQTIKRYTVALLNLFSNLSIPNFDKNGAYVSDTIVPIRFAQQSKNQKANAQTTRNIIAGNNFTIPRASLKFTSLSSSKERDTSKHVILHLNEQKPNKVVFSFNSVSYDFHYSLNILCLNFCDATAILENILPLFRPTYTLPVFELPIQKEPTSIILQLESQNIEVDSDISEDETRFVSLQLDFVLLGNLYLPIKDEAMVKKIRLYINEEVEQEFQHSLLFYNLEKIDDVALAEYQTTDSDFATEMRKTEGAKSFYAP